MKKEIVIGLNLYERNIYKYFINNTHSSLRFFPAGEWMAFFVAKINKAFLHKIYFNYIELPITTKCSLRCKECSNLIQFYECGTFFDSKKIINDVYRLSQVANGIGMLRVLGGEPLLHPNLKEVIEGILKNHNINSVQIVTNGTILFKEDILKVLRDERVSVEISYYGKVSRNYQRLINQLRCNNIKFCTNKNLRWTEQSDFTFHNRCLKTLEQILSICKMDCISILDGDLHLCPRSSNGTDLKIFDADKQDYVSVRRYKSKRQLKKDLYDLLNTKSIVACNYCNIFMRNKLRFCVAGEQTSKEQALKRYNITMQANRGDNR